MPQQKLHVKPYAESGPHLLIRTKTLTIHTDTVERTSSVFHSISLLFTFHSNIIFFTSLCLFHILCRNAVLWHLQGISKGISKKAVSIQVRTRYSTNHKHVGFVDSRKKWRSLWKCWVKHKAHKHAHAYAHTARQTDFWKWATSRKQ